MNLIPKPHKVEEHNGFLNKKTIKPVTEISDERLLCAIEKLPVSEEGTAFSIIIQDNENEAYELTVKQDEILIKAQSPAAAFYAIQTLRQLFKEENVPCCHIEDKPDFKHRGFYHDITRGKVPKVETIKKLIDEMAYYKLNSLQLYVEHTFEFEEYKDSLERTGYLSIQEIRDLDRYCQMNFIEFIPSLATFGHLYELLQKERFKHLREAETFAEREFFWENRMVHHTIDPTREESFELIKSLLDQYMANFTSDRFNICGDETFDLKTGRHKDEDTGKLYIDFVTKIIKYLQSKGKKVMMWADILLNHPEQIENLPEGVELLNWFYDKDPEEKNFKTIQESNRPQIVCPGTGSWIRLCEDYDTEINNISRMAEFGYKYGAEGVLNTNWGDLGNPCSIELAMFGLVLGAEKSWNVKTDIDDEYIKNVNALLYESEKGVEYIKRLSRVCAKISWNIFAKSYANALCGELIYGIGPELPSENDILTAIQECVSIINDVTADNSIKNNYKEQILIAAEGEAVMAELFAGQIGRKTDRITDTHKWLQKYCNSWRADNKESELREIEGAFTLLEEKYLSDGFIPSL